MFRLRPLLATALCLSVPGCAIAAESQVGYSVNYSGGSFPNVKSGQDLKLYVDNNRIRLAHKSGVEVIPARSITEVSYGEAVHHRIGTGAAVAVVSLGIGAIVAFSKSTKHYIGVTWADGETSGGIVLHADKNEYRGLLAALEGVSGRQAVDADSPRSMERRSEIAQARGTMSERPPEAKTEALKGIVVRVSSTPPGAEVLIDGEYWANTPTADLTRIHAGTHVVLVMKPGYQRWERKIDLAPGENRDVNAELEPVPVDPAKPRILGLD
jgi:hypothetical protein